MRALLFITFVFLSSPLFACDDPNVVPTIICAEGLSVTYDGCFWDCHLPKSSVIDMMEDQIKNLQAQMKETMAAVGELKSDSLYAQSVKDDVDREKKSPK